MESVDEFKIQGDPFEVDWELGLQPPKEHTLANGKGEKRRKSNKRNSMDLQLNLAQLDDLTFDNDLVIQNKKDKHHLVDHSHHGLNISNKKKDKKHLVEMHLNDLAQTPVNSDQVPPGHYVDHQGVVKKLPDHLIEHLSENGENDMHVKQFPKIDINEYLLQKE